jgi:hypothetical protein
LNTAYAAVVIFSGQDDGASFSGPFPNSTAAQTNFLSAAGAFGPVRTETFQSFAVGSGGPFSFQGGSLTLSTPFGVPFGGVNDSTGSNLYGFPLPGETKWLGFADGTATFNFSTPINSFGLFTTGVQSAFTSNLTFSFGSEVLNLPINVNGGASYFGLTDTTAFDSLTITNLSDDAWGISDVSFNSLSISAVPEPSTWAMMLLGFFSVGLMIRRARRKEALRLTKS